MLAITCSMATRVKASVSSLLLWIMICLINGSISTADVVSSERRLIQLLLARYAEAGRVARPVIDSSTLVQVQFGLRLELDEKEQVMTTSVWTRMRWIDELLTWDKAEFDNITSVILPADKVWIPDIVLVNTAETSVQEQSADLIVRNNGYIFWAPQRKYSSACLIDVTEYPYDKHTCDMWFQCIANSGKRVNITEYPKSPMDLDTYISSYKAAQEWLILNNGSSWHDRPRDVGMILMWSRRASVKFTLTVQRRAGFKGLLLIIPCALLSFLIPLVFCFPPERPDRHTLAMSLFASLTILLFMVNEVAPPSASFVPRLALYYCFNLLILLLATCCSAAVVNINKRAETREKVPKILKSVCIKGVGKALCLGKKLEHLDQVKRASRRSKTTSDDQTRNNFENRHLDETKVPEDVDDSTKALFVRLSNQMTSLEYRIAQKDAPKNEGVELSVSPEVRMEWATLSMVLDRLFFIVFFLMNFVSLGIFYPRKL